MPRDSVNKKYAQIRDAVLGILEMAFNCAASGLSLLSCCTDIVLYARRGVITLTHTLT